MIVYQVNTKDELRTLVNNLQKNNQTFVCQFTKKSELLSIINTCDRQDRPTTPEPLPVVPESVIVPIIKRPLDLIRRERLAADNHWSFIEMRADWKKRKMTPSQIQRYEKKHKEADEWFDRLSPKDQYALMRSQYVSQYDQAINAWYILDNFTKVFIYQDWKCRPPYKIKAEFLPN